MKKYIWPINFIFLQEVDSTNTYAKKHCSNYHQENEIWYIILSNYQTRGLGYGKNIWYAEKRKNLTFSIILNFFKNFSAEKLYIINIIVSNAIHKTLSIFSKKKMFWIKWPNDIISIDNKKIGGILTENNILINKIYKTIIGIGLNINQIKFDNEWNATSLKKIFNKHFQLHYIFRHIVFSIQEELFYFTKYGENFIKHYYTENLYLKNKISSFYFYKSETLKKGIIRSVDQHGFLIIEIDNELLTFSQKEIKFLI
ncbi:biotin--[acetyl-CoA-carboxylase] ligase [Blattabacterium cuenoti]|uniref:biotin--[acetyl-CoA-carboxylase] ligase n=1 Tax=Blattabacterium cuenoti TaxID=1653831 RepID=UPI00163CC73B|nr:biotin--[acetyl-CoA-carboxylase] ligase [Blattabacterium cuenoti]